MEITAGPVCPRSLTIPLKTAKGELIGTLLRRIPRPYGYELIVDLHDGSPLLVLTEEILKESERTISYYRQNNRRIK